MQRDLRSERERYSNSNSSDLKLETKRYSSTQSLVPVEET